MVCDTVVQEHMMPLKVGQIRTYPEHMEHADKLRKVCSPFYAEQDKTFPEDVPSHTCTSGHRQIRMLHIHKDVSGGFRVEECVIVNRKLV